MLVYLVYTVLLFILHKCVSCVCVCHMIMMMGDGYQLNCSCTYIQELSVSSCLSICLCVKNVLRASERRTNLSKETSVQLIMTVTRREERERERERLPSSML
eukprot:Platyproteum_vivax@DN12054_c1_g1_i1.p1